MLPWSEWLILYENGTTFSDADGPPEAAPVLGVLGLVQRYPWADQQLISHTYRIFRRDLGCWIEVQWDGLIGQCLTHCRDMQAVVMGETTSKQGFLDAMRRLNG